MNEFILANSILLPKIISFVQLIEIPKLNQKEGEICFSVTEWEQVLFLAWSILEVSYILEKGSNKLQ